MELHDFTIKVPDRKNRVISIIPLGDTHIGTRSCEIKKLRAHLDWIAKRPDTYVIGVGDYIDAVNTSDPRFAASMLPDVENLREYLCRMTTSQADEFINLMMPLAEQGKIIGLGIGNHELTLSKKYHEDIMYRICGRLNARYLGWASLTRLRFDFAGARARVITLYMEHSLKAGRKKGSKLNYIEDKSNDFDADIFVMGHSHDKIATTKTQLYVPKTGQLKLATKKRVYAVCPSFYNSYEEGCMSYAEIAGFSPTSTGVVRIDVQIKDDEIDYHLWQ